MSVCCNFLILFVDFFTFISHYFYIFVMLFVSGVMNHFHVFHVFHVFQHQPVRKRCCFRKSSWRRPGVAGAPGCLEYRAARLDATQGEIDSI